MALQKAYNIKVFNLSGVYQKTINEKQIMGDVRFTSQLDGGQGELVITISDEIDSTIVAYNNIIKVYENDTVNNGVIIYSGVVTNITRVSEGGGDYIEVRAIGLATMLTWKMYYSGSFTFSKNMEVSLIIKDIVDNFSTVYPSILSYTGTSIEATGITANFTFDYTKSLEAIRKVSGVATNTFYVDENGVVQYHPKTGAIGQLTHYLTAGKDIESIRIEENAEEVVNKYFLTWASGTISAVDATSQTTYGVRELRESNTAIGDVTTANNFGASYISKNKDAKRKIQIVVNSAYNIETIRPGDLVTVRNFDYTISSLQIQKIEYNTDRITIDLDQVTSLAREITRL